MKMPNVLLYVVFVLLLTAIALGVNVGKVATLLVISSIVLSGIAFFLILWIGSEYEDTEEDH